MAARKCYLVDTENIGTVWKNLLPDMGKNDSLILFYTENSPGISYPDMQTIISYVGTFDMIQGYTGRNALDFQIVTYLGYLLKTAAKTEYVIVSNDAGYDAVVKFWGDRDCNVTRLTTAMILKEVKRKEQEAEEARKVLEAVQKEDSSPVEDAEEEEAGSDEQKPQDQEDGQAEALQPVKDTIAKAIGSKYQKRINKLYDLMIPISADNKQELHTVLTQNYGPEGAELYKKLRPQFKAIKKLMNND